MASVKARAKRHALIKKAHWETTLPEYRANDDFRIFLLKLTNAFNEVNSEIRQKLVIDYWKTEGKPVDGFLKVSPFYFLAASTVVYMKSKDIPVTALHDKILLDAYHTVKDKVVVEIADKKKPTVSVKDNIFELAKKLASEIDGAIDDFVTVGNKMDVKTFLAQNNASAPVCKSIASFYTGTLAELKAVKTKKDEQLNEAYGHIPVRGLNNYISFVESIIATAEQMSAISKVTKARKPRAKKEKAPSVVANKVAFLNEYEPLKLKSVHPSKVVGAEQIWVFNTKYRKLFKYEALAGMTLTWKGTTLQNWDPSKSGAKTVRKPEDMLPQVVDTTKRRAERLFDDIKGVLAKVTGRMNNESIIVRVF